jgi:hypothetical protein
LAQGRRANKGKNKALDDVIGLVLGNTPYDENGLPVFRFMPQLEPIDAFPLRFLVVERRCLVPRARLQPVPAVSPERKGEGD